MQQLDLVHDDVWAALRGLVSACGGSKRVGPMLWPAKGEKASDWLDDCLNKDRAAKLCLEEFFMLLRIGRMKGWHHAKHYVDDETLYERSAPRDADTELAQLLREHNRLKEQETAVQTRLATLLERFEQQQVSTVTSIRR